MEPTIGSPDPNSFHSGTSFSKLYISETGNRNAHSYMESGPVLVHKALLPVIDVHAIRGPPKTLYHKRAGHHLLLVLEATWRGFHSLTAVRP